MTTRRLGGRLLIFGLCAVMTLAMARPADAATITVVNANDSGDGSLRKAIEDANPAGGDTITFDLQGCPCTITLASELVIDKSLTIRGPGQAVLTISGNHLSRVFRIPSGVSARLEHLQVSDGVGPGSTFSTGGGILSEGDLSIHRSTVRSNTAHIGGGIYATGLLTVSESSIAGNSARGPGGGIFLDQSGALTFIGSIISNNTAATFGGGLYDRGTATLVNSTISANRAQRGGGLAKETDEPLTLINTTVTSNTATASSPQFASGGGIVFISPSDPVVLTNSIVMGNVPDDVTATATNNNSLIGGDAATVIDPTLADNGGATMTHALVPGGPAIGAGSNAWLPNDALDLDGDGNTAEVLPVDQRGVGFPRVSGTNVDIGAFEAVCTAIGIAPAALPPTPAGGISYNQTVSASGGTGPYTFGLSVGALPPGIRLDPSAGALSGTLPVNGTYTFTVRATDAFGCIGERSYTITLTDPSCGIVIGPATIKTPYLATLYYQPISVTPSGQYTVTVSAGALPRGVYLFAIGHNWYLGGIPSAPGSYTFTLAAKKKNSPCAPTRTFTVIVPATVLPQLTCVAKTGGKQYTARFGYDNSTGDAVTIPVGADNAFTPGAQNRGQATTFQQGRVTNAFSVVFTVTNNNTDLALWYLRGPDGVRRPVNITTATSRCP